ncbi:MAG: filamentous hemagglutinin N-terminal domain-containing protein [Nostoc sp. ChiSLP02]|nr:filamentous hemagglutinin N-terminal domain-containing protein [Nostoc sp. DedSLP05]MDZ8102685.1 filamentous hemagglutinin N-terminal domain-containing protein [Nostoc sp. DedSLP01]MDZ8186916.1 filamentous hemagglutinin N-terminal domain-containing protein [Nostoc sp. ChiSLP02]
MSQNRSSWYWDLGIVSTLAIAGVLACSEGFALAQVQKDDSLGIESSTVTPKLIDGQPTDQIDGGAIRNQNLFHSFDKFSVFKGRTAYFNNSIDILNIIARVTGNSVSQIDGIIKTNGSANLFLINPNGIIFGANASLNINGSFVASTASSLNFADGIKFSATDPQSAPLLTVSVPIGLQFGTTAAPIRNQSQASPNGAVNFFEQGVGLQVQPGKTLAFIGGDITLEGGNLTAQAGKIELGSVAPNSLVSLSSTNQGWTFGYEGVKNFQNIELTDSNDIFSTLDTSGESGGDIHLQGKHVLADGTSQILAITLGAQPGGDLVVNASESVELGENSFLSVGSFDNGNSGSINITTSKFIAKDGAQVSIYSVGSGLPGELTINASNSVELIGGFPIPPFRDGTDVISSGLFSETYGVQNAGSITINTPKLRIEGGARISTSSEGIYLFRQNQFIPVTGNGGNLTVNASDSVELIGTSPNGSKVSGLFSRTQGPGDGGNLTVTTGQLIVKNGAAITVNSQARKNVIYIQGDPKDLGKAGDLNITANSILLDNKGKLTSNSESGKGGNIGLQVRDILLMRGKSQISTNAGGDKTGGNITINAPNGFIVAPIFGNSDITANAFSGPGGKIAIATKNIFGFIPRTRTDVEKLDSQEINPNNLPTNDITAFSQQNPSLGGTVQINSPDVDPSKGLVQLPVNLVDASQEIVAGCGSNAKIARSSFTNTGRGGTAADPTELLMSDAIVGDWIPLNLESENRAEDSNKRVVVKQQRNTELSEKVNSVNEPTQIVEAQGWVMDANGNVVLVAQVPTAIPHSSLLMAASCAAN